MRSVKRFTAVWKVVSSCTILLLIIGGLLASPLALAAPPVEATGCILDQPGNNGVNCNSNDITLSSPIVTVLDPCDYPGDFAQLQVLVDVTNNATQRYDLGVWLSIDGDPNNDGSASGLCSVLSLDPTTLDTDGDPADADGDACGDVKSTTNPVDIEQTDLGIVSLLCDDSDGDGFINVPVITSWKQSSAGVCTVSNEAWPGTSPKCTDNRDLTIPVPVPGRIVVNKDADPDDPQSFAFNLSGPDSGIVGGFNGSYDFSLIDDGITPENATFDTGDGTFVGGVPAGAYSITETVPAGWLQTSAVCSSDVDEINTDPSAIDLRPGETVTCDFINMLDSATINVVKQTVGGVGEFAFSWTGPTTSGGVTLNTDPTTQDSDTIITTETGTFTLWEVIVPPGWVLGSAACVDDNGGGSVGTWDNVNTINDIDLLPGDSVTCTFINQAIGTITLVKNTEGGDGSFDFVTDVPGLGTNIQTSAGMGQTSASNVPTGTYSIVETVPAGWVLDSATCDNGSPPDALVLETGDTVTCTFVDIKLGTIIVEKQTLPDGDPQQFEFTGNIGGTIGDGGQITLEGLLPATYNSTETVPGGWDLTSIICDDENSTGDTESATATFNLEAGEIVTCVFTNTKDGSIEVVKTLSDTGPLDETFGFTSNFNGAFNLIGDAATTGPIAVAPGSGYTVSEDDPSATGWVNTGASCSDGSDPSSDIVVSPGEAVVCTFTNTPLGSAVVIKDTVGGNGIFGFTGDAPIGPFSLDTTDQFTATTGDLFDYILTAGIYDVTETNIPAGFELTSIGCDNGSLTDLGSATASMDVQLAETVTCIFTNTADGTLIIRKETLPDGAEQGFEFTGSAAGTIHDYSTTAEEIVVSGQPGIYTSVESPVEGWVITDINCTGQVQSDVTYGDADVSVDLVAGETVICTFENTIQGSITIEKFTQGGVGPFTFNGDFGEFELNTADSNPDSTSFLDLLPGTYMVSEVVPGNWTLSDIQCSGQDASTVTIGGAGDFDPGDQGVTIDLADGESIVCTFVNDADGSITVTKVTDPAGSAQSFDFTGNITATLTDGQSSTAILVPAGNYAVSEVAVAGWDITDISCSDDDSSGTGDTANFVVSPGEDVNCTFTNTIQRGNIVVEKQTDPDGSTQSFDFTSSYGGFSLTDGQQNDSGPLLPSSEAGTYSVSESLPAGWDQTSAVCSDGSDPASIDLGPGETVTCVFTNTIQRGNIVVEKQTDPDGSTQSFDFTSSYGDGFSLTDGQQNDSGPLLPSSEAGTYSVSESLPAGWDQTSAICSNESSPDAINVSPGETVTCVFTNTIQRGNIVVEKQTDPDGSTQSFDFTSSYGGFSLTDGQQNDSGPLLPSSEAGAYSVSESLPSGWDQTSAVCSDGSDPASIDLGPGETVTCVFTNTIQRGNIVVEKQTDPDGSTQSFDFTSSYGDGFSLTDGQQNDSGPLLPSSEAGTYSVSESLPAGWDQTSAICSNESSPDAINVSPGETVTCVFTNTIQSSRIIVQKVTDPDTSTQEFGFVTNYGDPFLLTNGQTNDSGELLPSSEAGTYSVVEDDTLGWDQTSAVCSDGSAPTSIDVGPGETVTCVFTNTIQRGNIVVEKQTDPDGSTQSFDFTSSYGDGFSLTDGQQNDSGPLLPSSEAGTYSVTESLPSGWDQTSAVCSDGSDPASIDLGPGETVTCVFTNTVQRGNIVVVKETIPVGSPEDFDFTSNYGDPFSLSDGQQNDSGPLLPSSEATPYSVAEAAEPGWDLLDATCTGEGNTPEAINLLPGETVTCTFVNEEMLASVTIVKELLGLPDDSYCFSYTGPDDSGQFCIDTTDGTGEERMENIAVGYYSFEEIISGSYAVTSSQCSNGDSANSLVLGPGDDVTCTFVNVPVSPVPVNNPLALLFLILMMLAAGWYFRPAGLRRF